MTNKWKKLMLEVILVIITILLVNTVSAVSSSINVDVIETKDLDLFFSRVNDANFDVVVNRNTEFLRDVYPIADDDLNKYKGVVMNYEN